MVMLTNRPCIICRCYYLREKLILMDSSSKNRGCWKYLCRICIMRAYDRLTGELRAKAVEGAAK